MSVYLSIGLGSWHATDAVSLPIASTTFPNLTLGAFSAESGEKTALFEPFIYKMHYFTKTGSGQT
jgi:hypothetical protein